MAAPGRHFLAKEECANMPELRASAARCQGRNARKQHLGRCRVSETSKLTLLATASSPLGNGQEDPTSQSLLH